MKASAIVSAVLAFGAVSATPTTTTKQAPNKRATLPVVSASGNAFYTASGERFYIRGIDYQPGGSSNEEDPLAEPDVCKRDIAEFKKLGVNTVRVYMVDNSKSHDECMSALADAGIYLVLDLNTPKYSINRLNPYPSYNVQYLQNVFATVDAFIKYDNTLAFFSGNEVINEIPGTTVSAPVVKAITRDVKNYMNSRGYRHVPIGYSAADVSDNRMQTAHYFNCGSDDARSDFFAFNDYSWCSSDFVTAGWDVKVKNFTDYGIPIFLSEYGCNTNVRDFGEVSALMSSKMTGVYSGGLMYEYSMEDNGYGIVEISGSTVSELPEFSNYQKALASNPAPSGDGGAATTTHAIDCPTQDSIWEVDPSLIPAMPTGAEKFMKNGAGTGLGFSGPGSQDASGSGTSAQNITGGSASPSSNSKENGSPGPFDVAPVILSSITLVFGAIGAMLL